MDNNVLYTLNKSERCITSQTKTSLTLDSHPIDEIAVTSAEKESAVDFQNTNTLHLPGGEKLLRLRIRSRDNDIVKLNLPLTFVKSIIRRTGRLPMINISSLDRKKVAKYTLVLMKAIEENLTGEIINVRSSDNDIIKVIIK